MRCPACSNDMELIEGERRRSTSGFTVSRDCIYACHKCRIGIQTHWELFYLEGDE